MSGASNISRSNTTGASNNGSTSAAGSSGSIPSRSTTSRSSQFTRAPDDSPLTARTQRVDLFMLGRQLPGGWEPPSNISGYYPHPTSAAMGPRAQLSRLDQALSFANSRAKGSFETLWNNQYATEELRRRGIDLEQEVQSFRNDSRQTARRTPDSEIATVFTQRQPIGDELLGRLHQFTLELHNRLLTVGTFEELGAHPKSAPEGPRPR